MSNEYEDCLKRGKIKSFSRGQALVGKELETAKADLKRARCTFEEGDYKWATIQAYYSMFHSARGLLYDKNLREHSHYCLIAAMRSLYCEKKLLPVSLVEALQQAKRLREDADYYDRWSETGCRRLLNAAEELLAAACEITDKRKT